ncbi:MAG: radical SAM protein [Pseudobdellovibrionaceae bacterium]
MSFLRLIESYVLDVLSAKDRRLPMQIDITNACNLKCTHCYHSHHKNDNSLSFEQWAKIIDDYFNLINRLKYKPMIIICGGEPTISPHFNRILKYIADMTLIPTLLS